MTLPPKQHRFVAEYLVDLNATRAYLRAGYKCTEETARRNGPRLLTNAVVAAEVARLRNSVTERTMRTIADVMADIAKVRADAMQPVSDPHTGAQTMLAHKEALRALELEGKHLGAFDERLRLMGPDGGPVQQVSRIELVARKA